MAAVTLATLINTDAEPTASATEASCVAGHSRHTIISGTFKIEVNYFQQGSGDDFVDEDTFKTGLAAPLFATADHAQHNYAGSAALSATLDGVTDSATYKTITLDENGDRNTAGIIVKVYGY